MMESSPLSGAMLATVAYLILLIGSASGQQSPCPQVFSYKLDPNNNQAFGYIELNNLRLSTPVVRLVVVLSYNVDVGKQNLGSIIPINSNSQTLRNIYNNLPAQYRVNFAPVNVVPKLLVISVNGQPICSVQSASGLPEGTVKLEHILYNREQISSNGNQGNDIDVLRRTSDEFQSPPAQFQPQATPSLTDSDVSCGTVAPSLNSSSSEGIIASKGQFPWLAPIFIIERVPIPQYLCGSSIISRQHVVTTASCMHFPKGILHNVDAVSVVPGMYTMGNFFESSNQARQVAKIFVYDGFAPGKPPRNDGEIAVLKLKDPIIFNDFVRPICLWGETDSNEQIAGLEGFVSGWGTVPLIVNRYPSFVKATLVAKNDQHCWHKYDSPPSSRTFCADIHGAVPCFSEFGSGLAIKRGSRYYLRGIVVDGQMVAVLRLCDPEHYISFVDVAAYRSWLNNVIEQ